MRELGNFLAGREIPCQKFNYNVDTEVQSFDRYPAALTLSHDFKQLKVYIIKPVNFKKEDDESSSSDDSELAS